MNKQTDPLTNEQFMDGLIRTGLVMMLVVACFQVFSPFLNLMLWALILSVTLYPMHQKLAGKMRGNNGRASTLMVLVGLVLLGWPFIILAASVVDQLTGLYEAYHTGSLALPLPEQKVMEWPLIGQTVYDGWAAASADLPDFIKANKATIETLLGKGLLVAKSAVSGMFLFFASLVVAGIIMAYGVGGSKAIYAILVRIAGEKQGPKVHNLATMTTRSVAVGVLGVALIQSLLLGIGFIFAGVPAPGILALLVLVLGILQLPALLVTIPVLIWMWGSGDASTAMNVVWTVYLVITGLSDNVLKPVLLGRGVDAPMPIILIGALGGMVASGFTGLFIGAVLLAVGYQIFMQWVSTDVNDATESTDALEAGE
jgi:predicted PurR-regulated permease PerM